MRILITGATGFIGKNLVRVLVSKGHKITCLARRTSKKQDIKYLEGLGTDLFYSDINKIKRRSIRNILDKVDYVYHLAGSLGNFNKRKEEYLTHVEGTRKILNECKNQKFIYCSSAGVLGPVLDGNEKSRLNPTNLYEETKCEAEKIVRSYKNHVIVRPEFVYGQYDFHVLPLFRAVEDRKFFIIGDGTNMLHPTYIDDLIFCMVKCLDSNIKNDIFIVAGEKGVSVNELIRMLCKELDVEVNKTRIPIFLAKAYVSVFERVSRLFKINPVLTGSRLDFFTKTRTFNIEKAKKSLDYKPIKLEKGIKKTIYWYRKNGYL